MNKDNTSLAVAAVFSLDWQAHIAKAVLDEHGIQSVIDNEIMGSTLPIGFNSIGGFRLMVFECDLKRARDLIAESL